MCSSCKAKESNWQLIYIIMYICILSAWAANFSETTSYCSLIPQADIKEWVAPFSGKLYSIHWTLTLWGFARLDLHRKHGLDMIVIWLIDTNIQNNTFQGVRNVISPYPLHLHFCCTKTNPCMNQIEEVIVTFSWKRGLKQIKGCTNFLDSVV